MPTGHSFVQALNLDVPRILDSFAHAAWFRKQSNLDFRLLVIADSMDRLALWQQQEEKRKKAVRQACLIGNDTHLPDEDSEASSSDGDSDASTMIASSCTNSDIEDAFSEEDA
mmetsp:Transcript_76898/g.152183  ORF Transcript_76898/g.152183 Transcript_76898/m.152183 type:complete len:113 (-) Transcript_76898:141-479(-)